VTYVVWIVIVCKKSLSGLIFVMIVSMRTLVSWLPPAWAPRHCYMLFKWKTIKESRSSYPFVHYMMSERGPYRHTVLQCYIFMFWMYSWICTLVIDKGFPTLYPLFVSQNFVWKVAFILVFRVFCILIRLQHMKIIRVGHNFSSFIFYCILVLYGHRKSTVWFFSLQKLGKCLPEVSQQRWKF